MRAERRIGALWVRWLCAVALVLVGFAHAPPQGLASPLQLDAAAYMLPDGSIPDLCEPGHADADHGGKMLGWKGCEACRISAVALLPLPTDLVGEQFLFFPASARLETPQLVILRPFPPSAAPRAPPLSTDLA